jgi:hypothetical protein
MKYTDKENPYEFQSLQWYSYNVFVELLQTALDCEALIEPIAEREYSEYMELETNYEQEEYIKEIVTSILPDRVQADGTVIMPASLKNEIVDVVTKLENNEIPPFLYFLSNPDKRVLPESFNALTNPECFEMTASADADYESAVVYQDILKKTLDARNNNLDARRGSGLSLDQVVSLATTNKNNLSFSPNSFVNNSTDGAKGGMEIDTLKLEREAREREQKIRLSFLKETHGVQTKDQVAVEKKQSIDGLITE